MQTYFEDLYAYHRWANSAVLRTMSEAMDVPPSASTLFSHLLNAHFTWLDRIENRPSAFAIWHEHPVANLATLSEQAYQRTTALLQSRNYKANFGTIVHYQNTKGVKFQDTVQEILTHVSDHTTHHRAQVVRELRQHGVAPPATDYIFYKRTPISE